MLYGMVGAAVYMNLNRLSSNLLVAGLMLLAGKVALSLAIAPGNVALFWPPAGIAVAALIVGGFFNAPGVFLGAAGVNFWHHWQLGTPLDVTLILCVLIGIGCTLQAALARLYIVRFLGGSIALKSVRELAIFFFLCGPGACWVASLIGVYALLVTGLIAPELFAVNWWSWFIGDMLGVVIFAPLLLAFIGKPRILWRTRIRVVAFPLMLALTLCISISVQFRSNKQESQNRELESRTTLLVDDLETLIESYARLLHGVKAFYLSNEEAVDKIEFDTFVGRYFHQYEGIHSIQWLPHINASERNRFESSVRASLGVPDFRITELDERRQNFLPAAERDFYLPVLYLFPDSNNLRILGYDVGSHPQRAKVLQAMDGRDEVIASGRFLLLRMDEPSREMGFRFLLPLYRSDLRPRQALQAWPGARKNENPVLGYFSVVVRVNEMIDHLTIPHRAGGDLNLQVVDGDGTVIYSAGAESPFGPVLEQPILSNRVFNLNWRVLMWPAAVSPAVLPLLSSNSDYLIGVFLTAILSIILLVLAGRNEDLRIEIEKRSEIEQHLREARDSAESANRAKSLFLANMNHELRTPLGAVLGFSKLLADPGVGSEERLSYVSAIQRNGELLSRLIDDVIDLSKVEAGHLSMESKKFSVQTLVRDVVRIFEVQLTQKNIQISFDIHPDAPDLISADESRIRQVLLNLVGNALKFTEQGEIRLRYSATVGNDPMSWKLRFEVEDTGSGIPEHEQQRIFEPFVQGESSTAKLKGGAGLGLALSRRLAKLMGGDLFLKNSVPGKGSCFAVELSVQKDSTRAQNVARKSAYSDELRGRKILVVEDSEDTQELTKILLTRMGAKVTFASNGQEAIDRVPLDQPEAILMDLQMPVKDGYEATRELRSLGFQGPIIALTAYALREVRDRCFAMGMDDFLTKPVDSKQLFNCLVRHLGLSSRPDVEQMLH